MDCTVVNFLPYALEERKPGLVPERYYVPMSKKGRPGILHISSAMSHLYIRDGRTHPIRHPSDEVAESICNDYNNAQLEADNEACPALFWVYDKVSSTDILTDPKFKEAMESAKAKQLRWFTKLVSRADDDWARWGQHRIITDIQKYAAAELGLTNKPWYQSPEPEEFVKCPACRTMVEKTSAICHNCKYVIDEGRAIELGLSSKKGVKSA